ncbi:unnamed protein product, partial [Mesorhabditis spiculigera]
MVSTCETSPQTTNGESEPKKQEILDLDDEGENEGLLIDEDEPTTSNDGQDIVEKPELIANGKHTDSHDEENGNDAVESIGEAPTNGVKRKFSDDDDVLVLSDSEEASQKPPAKQPKVGEDVKSQASPVPDDPTTAEAASKDGSPAPKLESAADEKPKTEPQLTSSEALLNRIVEYVDEALDKNVNTSRKVLDALLGAINVQVQREPLSVRKLILDKQLVLPNTISEPPSQVVDLVIEHDPDNPLSKVVTKMFGEERPKYNDTEKKERALLKQNFAAPHMTRLLVDIGHDLIQESTYFDIVHARNLPEAPKNMETYKQVAAQLKPVWETLKKRNEPYKLKQMTCQVCQFKSESRLVMLKHRSQLHHDGRKFQCAFCTEVDTNENRMMKHYLEAHEIVAAKQEQPLRNPCFICDEDFQYKGQRDQHMRSVCKRDFAKVRYVMAPKNKEDVSAVSTWMWEKPPVDPTILAQQQQNQREHQAKQRAQAQAQLLAQQQAQAAARKAMMAQQQREQLAAAQQRLRIQQQQQQNAAAASSLRTPQNANLLQAMQRHLSQMANQGSKGRGSMSAHAFATQQQQLAQAKLNSLKSQMQSTQKKDIAAVLNAALRQNTLGTGSPAAGTSAASSSSQFICEICDSPIPDRERYLTHLQVFHKQMKGKAVADMQQGAPLACSRCRDRFWTYEGLERHLVMAHGLVTADLLHKAQNREDGGRCKLCSKQYAFNMLQHLVTDHHVKLCSAEIMYSCDVCSFKCTSYNKLEEHLTKMHPKTAENDASKQTNGAAAPAAGDADVVTLD